MSWALYPCQLVSPLLIVYLSTRVLVCRWSSVVVAWRSCCCCSSWPGLGLCFRHFWISVLLVEPCLSVCHSILMSVTVDVVVVVIVGVVVDSWWCYIVSWCGGWLSVGPVGSWSCWSYLGIGIGIYFRWLRYISNSFNCWCFCVYKSCDFETRKRPTKTVKPLTRTRETPTRKTWGRGSMGTGTGWPGIPQGYPWYSLSYSASAPPDESTSHYQFMHANCRPPLHQSATFLLRWW